MLQVIYYNKDGRPILERRWPDDVQLDHNGYPIERDKRKDNLEKAVKVSR